MLNKVIRYFLENKLITVLLLVVLLVWGLVTTPFNWNVPVLPRDRVPVDAIPDIGPNQQIVVTEWKGRSPQDVEDQITYPLTTALLGVPGVKVIRSNSIFGLSMIYIIFKEEIEFYWSRTRILEKLNSLPPGTLPEGVQPKLGPDATGLGQIFWYTLEGRNPETGEPAGGWDPHELRTLQDFYVGYSLTAVDGVSEVAPIGGYVKEYQVDIDPGAMETYGVDVAQIMKSVQKSNLDVGASTMEYNKAEYLVRGLGYLENLQDLREAVITVRNNTPIRIKDVAVVNYGPATRRGGLDKAGSEAVGACVIARYGSNPLEVINNVKEKIKEIEPGLPSKKLSNGTVSKVNIVPFYDRTGLIKETLGTLESALSHEILITIIVIMIMVMNLKGAFLVSGMLPVAVLMSFIAMRYFGVTANIVALSGIAIAIGTMVDMAIVLTENIIRHLEKPGQNRPVMEVVYEATSEVASAIITSISIIIISFLPVFTMQYEEGKLFRPLAFTKTFALLSSIILTIFVIPAFAHWFFDRKKAGSFVRKRVWKWAGNGVLLLGGLIISLFSAPWAGIVLMAFGINNLIALLFPEYSGRFSRYVTVMISVLTVAFLLAHEWLPLGPENSLFVNFMFIVIIMGSLLGLFAIIIRYYSLILRWCLHYKGIFLGFVGLLVLMGLMHWLGFNTIFGFFARGGEKIGLNLRKTIVWQKMEKEFPGVGREFMPPLDEGSYLLMPTTMPHSGVEENIEVMRNIDRRVQAIPEVRQVVGKWGRIRSALDPAPISMFENVINYKPEYKLDEDGRRVRFKVDEEGNYVRNQDGELIPDPNGKYYRNWREHIQSTDDIWQEIVKASKYPGLTGAPKLQPIQTRLIMLSTGMRAPLGIKVFGPELKTIESFGLKLEEILKDVEGIEPASVFADRVVGKPYLEIDIDRQEIARYGLTIKDVQHYLEVAVGGIKLTTTVEGRERFPVRVRYAREYRDDPHNIKEILIPAPTGTQVPLEQLADIKFIRGPQVIKSENTFLDSYVIFDKKDDFAEMEVVDNAKKAIKEKINSGELKVPSGVSYIFAGNFKKQIRATRRLSIVIPISLLIIFLFLYFEFKSVPTSAMIFSSLLVALAGGFLLMWLYGQEWFMNFSIAGHNLRDMFQMGTINLSVAVWVGFIALFGIAVEGSVVIGVYLKQIFGRRNPQTVHQIRDAVLEAGTIRIRPTLMTTATTILALLPVLSSTGKGSDIMVPMAIPTFGGMTVQIITFFVVPVLYSMWQEGKLNKRKKIENRKNHEN